MAFIDSMRGKISAASQSTMQKARELSEIARLNGIISEAETMISDLYTKIGFEIYQAYNENPIPEAAELIQQVNQLHEKIDECKNQIQAINAANSCPQCGAKIKQGMAFCSSCGYKIASNGQPSTSAGSFCKNCGAPIPRDSLFCSSCGAKVE